MAQKGTTWQCQSESESEFESRNPNSNTHRLRLCSDCQSTVRMKHSLGVFATWQIDKSLVRFFHCRFDFVFDTGILWQIYTHTHKLAYTLAHVNKICNLQKNNLKWMEPRTRKEKNSTYQNAFELFMYNNWMKILQLEFEIYRQSSKSMIQIAYAMRELIIHTHTDKL